MSYYVMSCYDMSCYVMLCDVMLYHVMLCNSRPYYVMSCHVILAIIMGIIKPIMLNKMNKVFNIINQQYMKKQVKFTDNQL